MKKKRIIISILAIAIIGGGWFGYGEYSRKVKDLDRVKADLSMSAAEIISVFEKNEADANAKLLDKIIAVKGTVRKLEKNDRGQYTIVLDDAGISSVRCSMNSVHVNDLQGITEGNTVTVKGACTGFNHDELLGSDVILNRCVLEKNNNQ